MTARCFAWLIPLQLLFCISVQAETIKAVTETTPYAFISNGEVSGPASAVVEATLADAGLDYQLGLYPWARAYDMALQQDNVLIYLIARTPEREQLFKWVGEVTRYEPHLYKLKARQNIQLSTLEDAKNYLIGVVRDDIRHEYLKQQGFTKLAVAAQNTDNIKLLFNEQIELLPLSEIDARRLCQVTGFDFNALERVITLDDLITGLYLAYSHGTDDSIVERTRQSFERLRSNGKLDALMSSTR